MLRSLVTLVLPLVTLLAGCSIRGNLGRPAVRGSGTVVEVVSEVLPFATVWIEDALHATVEPGETCTLRIRGDDNLLPYVVHEVIDGQLRVRVEGPNGVGIDSTEPIQVFVTTPTLQAVVAKEASTLRAVVEPTSSFRVEARAASDVEVVGLAVDSLLVEAAAASTVTLSGHVRQLELKAKSASTIEGSYLETETVTVELQGASRADVRVLHSVQGEASGASTLTVLGAPAEQAVETSGASSVRFESESSMPASPSP